MKHNAHTSLVNACVSLINARGGYAFKVQSGVLPIDGRYVHAGRPGVPDVVGVLEGRTIFVEVKTGTGRLSAAQRQVHEELRKRQAPVFTIRTIAELQSALDGRPTVPPVGGCPPARGMSLLGHPPVHARWISRG